MMAAHSFHIRRGLDLPLAGAPEQTITDGGETGRVGLVGDDAPGMRLRVLAAKGQRVRAGQPLLCAHHDRRIVFPAPAAGIVAEIHLSERRALRSIVVARGDRDEAADIAVPVGAPESIARAEVVAALLAAGVWTALRTRPFGRIPDPDTAPGALFVTAIDTNPLAPDPEGIVADQPEAFAAGLAALARLTDGPVFLCTAPDSKIAFDAARVTHAAFSGPHPAGLPGTHMHLLFPVGLGRTAWQIAAADVIAAGNLFLTGRADMDRVVALAGPPVTRPRLVRTTIGADLMELGAGETDAAAGDVRVISGSVLSGRRAVAPTAFLGRTHAQVTMIAEATGGRASGFSAHGILRWPARTRRAMTTARPGATTAIYPLEAMDRLLPHGFLAVPLLRALAAGDSERALALGCLELDEEDLALCTFACPARQSWGGMLRAALSRIEAEL